MNSPMVKRLKNIINFTMKSGAVSDEYLCFNCLHCDCKKETCLYDRLMIIYEINANTASISTSLILPLLLGKKC